MPPLSNMAAALMKVVVCFCCSFVAAGEAIAENLKATTKEPVIESDKQLVSTVAPTKIKPDGTFIFKTIGEVQLKMDRFDPPTPRLLDPAPAVVFFFGGGWNSGSTNQFHQQARFFADRGVVAFCAEYRIKNKHGTTPYECVADGKSAIRWVRAHADQLGIDPNKIIASGGSAGGHVAACTGIIEGREEPGEDLSTSSLPNAMILFNPVIDTTKKGYGAKRFKPNRRTELSPVHQVRAGLVPTIIFHGTADKTVPFENAERFNRLMLESGNKCQLVSYEGQGHGFFNSPLKRPKAKDYAAYHDSMQQCVLFLRSMGYLEE